VVNIDQRTDFQREKIIPSVPVSGSMFRACLIQRGAPDMFGFHALPTEPPPLSLIERPRCQNCQARTFLRHVAAGPAGYDLRTFACPNCDRVQRTLVVSDPMSGDAKGWLRGELKAPD
jgi:hypothetical protein